MQEPPNDNDLPRGAAIPAPGPDAHGQAAMVLVESLLHGLIARSALSVADAVEIVGVAADVKQEVAEELGDSPGTLRRSLALLEAIRLSLSNDLPADDRA